jgi:hypothetical protein
MVRRSRRILKQPRIDYAEDSQWERAVRKAEIQRDNARQPKRGNRARKKDEFGRPVGEDWNRLNSGARGALPRLEGPQQRVDRVLNAPMPRKSRRLQPIYKVVPMTKQQRNLLLMNPGDTPIAEATYSLSRGDVLPEWASQFSENLYQKEGVLYFRDSRIDLPMAFKQEKRDAVKRLYFDPKEPSTIQPVTDDLRTKFANISKRNVTHILRSLETYQLNFGRRLPPKIASRTLLKQPGIIAMDMFFPSQLLGWWGKFRCLTCMDTWSRFCRVYALEKKDYESTKKAMESFLSEFASLGHLPRRLISDRGTDLAGDGKIPPAQRSRRSDDHSFENRTTRFDRGSAKRTGTKANAGSQNGQFNRRPEYDSGGYLGPDKQPKETGSRQLDTIAVTNFEQRTTHDSQCEKQHPTRRGGI